MEVVFKNVVNEKLRKDFHIIIPAKMISDSVEDYLRQIQQSYVLNGFRKGQVPIELIREKHGSSITAEKSDKAISEALNKVIKDNNLKIASSPKIELKTSEEKKDIELVASIEIFPDIPEIDISKIELVSYEAVLSQNELDDHVKKVFKQYCDWESQDQSYLSKLGDLLNIDYQGKIDNKDFDGGTAKGFQIELGTKTFIDNFEDQLVGKKIGDEIDVSVKFPNDYFREEYSGKNAVFKVKINSILRAKNQEFDDNFTKERLGIESKEKLLEVIKEQITNSYKISSDNLLRKELFDYLEKNYRLELPKGLVSDQLDMIWQQVEQDLKVNPNKFRNEIEKEKARSDKQKLAERMVCCGLIISEIANKNQIQVSSEELNREIHKMMKQYPDQQEKIREIYEKNPQAIQQIRGQILEEKVINYIKTVAKIEKKEISSLDFDKLWFKLNQK